MSDIMDTLNAEEQELLETARRRKARAARPEEEATDLLDDAHNALDAFSAKAGKERLIRLAVLKQVVQLLNGVELMSVTNPTALLSVPITEISSGSQPTAVASAANVSQTVADKLQELADQMGEGNDATALDKLLKLTKGLSTLDQPAVAKRLDLAERIFDQSLANALEIASGGSKLQIEIDHHLVSGQLTAASTELDNLRPVAVWAKKYTDELEHSPNAAASAAREVLMLQAAKGNTPQVADQAVVDERDTLKEIVDYVVAHSKPAGPGTHGKASVEKLHEGPDSVKTKFTGKFRP